MARGKFIWHGKQASDQIESEMKRRLSACAIALVNHAKKLISIDGTAKGAVELDDRGKFTKRKLIYNANPSNPGEPPHVQTGRLRGSVAWELVGMIARVGTNVKYGRWLELGTKKMAARPWLRRSLIEMKPRIQLLLSKPIRFKSTK